MRAYVALTTAYRIIGQEENARAAAEEILRINPYFSLESESYKDSTYKWFLTHDADKELIDIALNKAGLK